MPAPSHQPERRTELPRIPCAACEHSEFVHGDAAPRTCLYTECRCAGFTRFLAA